MGFLAKLIQKGAKVGEAALVASARAAQMKAPKKKSSKRTVEDCSPCAAKQTAMEVAQRTWKGTDVWGDG